MNMLRYVCLVIYPYSLHLHFQTDSLSCNRCGLGCKSLFLTRPPVLENTLVAVLLVNALAALQATSESWSKLDSDTGKFCCSQHLISNNEMKRNMLYIHIV